MTMTINDPILAPSRGSAAQLVASLDQPDAKDRAYADALARWAEVAGVDFADAATQFAIETADGTSPRWNGDFNPAGIAIPLDTTAQPWKIPDGEAAARLHIQCLYSLVMRKPHPKIPLWPEAETWLKTVWLARMTDPAFPAVRTIDDLDIRFTDSRGEKRSTWAWGYTEGDYAPQFPPKAQRIFGNLPDSGKGATTVTTAIPTTPTARKPTIYNLARDYARFGITRAQAQEILASKFVGRSGARPRVIFYHIQEGITTGSLPYWASPKIDASSTVMIQKDGSILQVIPEADGPWTNGDVQAPTPQANEVLALGGNPNIWTLSMEVEGEPGQPLTPAQVESINWQTQDWLMRYPEILTLEWCLCEHAYVNSVTRARCGLYLYDESIVATTNDWLAGAAVAKPTPPQVITPAPLYPQGMTEQLARRLYGSHKVSWASEPFTFDLGRSECRYWLAHGRAQIPEGGSYQEGQWPQLVEVIRRGDGKTRTFQWSDGDVYEQVVKGQ